MRIISKLRIFVTFRRCKDTNLFSANKNYAGFISV
nr:MAG TPA: hypothetical protein [Caudoviricetes sp.]